MRTISPSQASKAQGLPALGAFAACRGSWHEPRCLLVLTPLFKILLIRRLGRSGRRREVAFPTSLRKERWTRMGSGGAPPFSLREKVAEGRMRAGGLTLSPTTPSAARSQSSHDAPSPVCLRQTSSPKGRGGRKLVLGGLLAAAFLYLGHAPTAAAVEPLVEETVFFPTDRPLMQRLATAETLIADRRWGEAVRLLGSVLEAPEDYFFQPDRKEEVFRSLKTEAQRLLGQLPPEGRESVPKHSSAPRRSNCSMRPSTRATLRVWPKSRDASFTRRPATTPPNCSAPRTWNEIAPCLPRCA